MQPRTSTRILATLLITMLPWAAVPAGPAEAGATLAGSIVRSGSDAPMAGAKLHAGDPKTDRLFTSAPADAEGNFVLAELPPATYSLAVESEGGLYLVETPLALAPGATQTLNLAVTPQPVNFDGDDSNGKGNVFNFKENPLTATLLFLGIVGVLGWALGGSSDSAKGPPIPPSPSTPPSP